MKVNAAVYQALDKLMDELDVRAITHSQEKEDYWVCKRKYSRNPFRTSCTVRFLPLGAASVAALPGRTRNLSRNGLGVVVRRMFGLMEPIEIEVSLLERPRMYMGGMVRFCRYAGRGYYELGIELKAAGTVPIFSNDPTLAARVLDWFKPVNHHP